MIYPNQIYRHFKGGIYLILAIAKSESNSEGEFLVIYRSLNGDDKVWTRDLSDFESGVPQDRFNPTGQTKRFELVSNFRNQLSMASTNSLIEELRGRKDSPLSDLDLDGFNDRVVQKDYLVCQWSEPTENMPKGFLIMPLVAVDSIEKAKKFIENHPERCSSRTKIIKRVNIDVGL